MRPPLSRGNSAIEIKGNYVTKTDDSLQPLKMRMFPAAFVPVLAIEFINGGRAVFTMPRLHQPDMKDKREALTCGLGLLQRHVWSQADLFVQPPWRDALREHLVHVAGETLKVRRIEKLVEELPEVRRPCAIHGDPTFANILKDRHRGYLWIDPLDREYIPHDAHVDLGKVFQSCWSYEELLYGDTTTVKLDEELVSDLTDFTQLDAHVAMNWCLVHLIRLLPYQTKYVRQKYVEVLRDVGF